MAYCRVLLCNLNKKSVRQDGNFLFISNKHLVTFHFPLAIYRKVRFARDQARSLYSRRILSAIRAINSEFVGLPFPEFTV